MAGTKERGENHNGPAQCQVPPWTPGLVRGEVSAAEGTGSRRRRVRLPAVHLRDGATVSSSKALGGNDRAPSRSPSRRAPRFLDHHVPRTSKQPSMGSELSRCREGERRRRVELPFPNHLLLDSRPRPPCLSPRLDLNVSSETQLCARRREAGSGNPGGTRFANNAFSPPSLPHRSPAVPHPPRSCLDKRRTRCTRATSIHSKTLSSSSSPHQQHHQQQRSLSLFTPETPSQSSSTAMPDATSLSASYPPAARSCLGSRAACLASRGRSASFCGASERLTSPSRHTRLPRATPDVASSSPGLRPAWHATWILALPPTSSTASALER